MDFDIKHISLRLLCGDVCKETEIPCAIEYLTQNGSATLFAAALAESLPSNVEKIQFLELGKEKWNCNILGNETQQLEFLWNDIKDTFEKNKIFIETLKSDSIKIQKMIQKEKQNH